jgi:pSer/pThr/pTyr-binding forkhead associated (FHA) protein
VSRRHCEVFETDGRLMLRDLGSSNGTYVNGMRVLGQQPLKVGDVISIGGVALRVDPVGGEAPAAPVPTPAGDTAEQDEVVDAVEVDEADDFEVSIDTDDDGFMMGGDDAIPLEDETPPTPAPSRKPAAEAAPQEETVDLAFGKADKEADGAEDDAVAQFLMDLKLDDED